ncbi:hypothetical protein [Streptomyces beigongshangae]|uniref:hypothetical protein n=1 Tax=Streptomyces beigongshangae TaxID=2841597 RepID=UPI001C85AA5C|nr:hypothetical protein [Streptomyces sp. REN17]
MPRSIHDILAQAALPDPFTDEDVASLKQEVAREVTATLMFGTPPAPEDHFPTTQDRADTDLQALASELLYSDDTAAHLATFAKEPADVDGALHFACLLSLADISDGAQWWWQFAAGAGNATAAYCLHLFHLGRGELRDADHWAHQIIALDTDIHHLTPLARHQRPPRRPTRALCEAVRRLEVGEVEEWGFRVQRPDSRLAHQVEELAGTRG